MTAKKDRPAGNRDGLGIDQPADDRSVDPGVGVKVSPGRPFADSKVAVTADMVAVLPT